MAVPHESKSPLSSPAAVALLFIQRPLDRRMKCLKSTVEAAFIFPISLWPLVSCCPAVPVSLLILGGECTCIRYPNRKKVKSHLRGKKVENASPQKNKNKYGSR